MNSVFQRTSHFFIVFLLFCMPSYSTANVQQSIQTLAKSLKNLAMLLSSKEQTKKQESDGKEIVLFRPQPQPLQRSPLELAKINLEEYSIAQSIDEINEKKN